MAKRSIDINLLNLQKGLEQAYPFSFSDEESLEEGINDDLVCREYVKNSK